MNKINKRGYILVLTLGIIALAMMLVTSILLQSINYQKRAAVSFEVEQTRLIVMSGLQLASSQISLIVDKETKDEKAQWVKQLLPIINSWQTIKLSKKDFEVDATITLNITAENGKINISKLAEKDKKILDDLDSLIKKETEINLSKLLKNSKENLKRSVEDVTELKINKLVFAQPDLKDQKIALLDLFTAQSRSDKINPWFLTNSLLSVLNLKTSEKNINELVKKFKTTLKMPTDWNTIFAPIYGKTFEELPQSIQSLISTEFEVNAFGIICYAQVGKVIQKIYAILEKDIVPSSLDKRSMLFKITKLYWL